jgi:hypothetical protein
MYTLLFFRHPLSLLVSLTILVMGIIVVIFMNMADHRTPSEQMSDVTRQFSNDAGNIARIYRSREADDKARNDARESDDKAHNSGN